MVALIRKANTQVRLEMANKPKTKRKERMVETKRKREREKQQHFLKRKMRQDMSASKGDKGCIHVMRVHDTTHLAVTTRQGNRR